MLEPAQFSLDEFSSLVREHQAGLRGFIRALGVEAVWVDDLAQEAFIVAYRRYESFDSQKDFGRWLRGIARNLVANERRKEARHARLLDGPFTDLMLEAQSDASTEDAVDARRLVEAMNDCVGQLPEHSRELLRRRYREDENATLLATAFQMNPDAIRQSLMRIRTLVKQCIEKKLAWR
jgi:RNA polymerase sigma-70 factor, ECF subfamily